MLTSVDIYSICTDAGAYLVQHSNEPISHIARPQKVEAVGVQDQGERQIGFEITYSGEQQAAQVTGFNGLPV